MSEAKTVIFNKIRKALGRQPGAGLDQSMPHPGAGPIPARTRGSEEELLARFTDWAKKARADVCRVASPDQVPGAVSDFLQQYGLTGEIAVAPFFQDHQQQWQAAGLKPSFGHAPDQALVSVTPAFSGIAETGTCVLLSGPKHPSRLNMLPDNHIVVLHCKDIVGSYEAAWQRVLAQGPLPRTVLWVTGPSLTGDIEQTLQQGAHGPRKLQIILVG